MNKREKIIEILVEIADVGYEHNVSEFADQILALDDWISVEDELPEPYTSVLVYDKLFVRTDRHSNEKYRDYGYRPEGVRFGQLTKIGMRSEGVNGKCEITHWKPISTPPIEKLYGDSDE